MNSLIPAVLGTLFIASSAVAQTQTRIEHQPFGSAGGVPVELYVLTSTSGAVAKIMTYGATLTELDVPNRAGRLDDVVLGFDSLKGYLGSEPYFGATVGRVGNRIAKGRFSLNGKSYQLATNDGPNHLHGGIKGFDKVVWQAEVVSLADGPGVKFTHVSADGEEGYPGKCTVSVVYQLSGTTLALSYEAVSDKDTPVNVTNHSYFNLGGAENGAILGHVVTLYADRFTPVDAFLIPTGELRPVAGTPMDFRQPTRVGARIKEVGGKPVGYDHNYVINQGQSPAPGHLLHVATVSEPTSGRVMDVWSTEPGVQFYSGNFLDGSLTGKKGVVYCQYWGLALETQHFPDSVNHPNFPSYVLRAGDTYRSATIYRFSTQ